MLLAIVAFAPTFFSGFAADDYLLRYATTHAANFSSLYTTDPFSFQGGGNFYRPIQLSLYYVIDLISSSPSSFHVACVLIYALVVLEVWWLLSSLRRGIPALAGAGLFAVYPRHSEAVAWVASSGDLLATLFGLATILVAIQGWNRVVRLALCALLAAAAAAAKESAFVLAILLLLVRVARREPVRSRAAWEPMIAIVVGQAAVLALRLSVLHGIGKYSDHPWTPGRAFTAAASDVLAAASPPQVALLDDVSWLILPIVLWLAAAVVVGIVARRHPDRRRLIWSGLAWAAISLVPTLNLVIDLDTSNGERFFFLPSVGLAIVAAAITPDRVTWRQLASISALAAVFLGVTIDSSLNWQRGSTLASKVIDEVTADARGPGEVLLLTAPETYRNARVVTPGLDAAVALNGGRARVAWCANLELRSPGAGQVTFRPLGSDQYVGETRGSARFGFPIDHAGRVQLTRDCSFGRGPTPPRYGAATSVHVRLEPAAQPVHRVYFDGERLIAAR